MSLSAPDSAPPPPDEPACVCGSCSMSAIAERELEAGVTAPFTEGFDPLKLSEGKTFK